jgi:hypothetical protein
MDWETMTQGQTKVYRGTCASADFAPLPQVGEGKMVPERDIKRMAEVIAMAWDKLAHDLVPNPEKKGKIDWNCLYCQIWDTRGLLRIVPGNSTKLIQPTAVVELFFPHVEEGARSKREEKEPHLQLLQEMRLRSPIEQAITKSFKDNLAKNAMRKMAKANSFRIFRQVEDKKDRLLELEGFKLYL